MKRQIFEGEAMGLFFVPGQDSAVGGTLKLQLGKRAELRISGRLGHDSPVANSTSSGAKILPVVHGTILLLGEQNVTKKVTLVNVRFSRLVSQIPHGIEFGFWRVETTLLGNWHLNPEIDKFEKASICVAGFPESYGPAPNEMDRDDAALFNRTAETLGEKDGVGLSAFVWVAENHSERQEQFFWEASLQILPEEPEDLWRILDRARAVSSGYSVLTGSYSPPYWIRLIAAENKDSKRLFDVYAHLAYDWSNGEPRRRPQSIDKKKDREFMLAWIIFFNAHNSSKIAEEFYDALHAGHMAKKSQKVDWKRELLRLGGLSEAIFRLQPDYEGFWPTEESFNNIWPSIKDSLKETIRRQNLILPVSTKDFIEHLRKTWRIVSRDSLAQNIAVLLERVEVYTSVSMGIDKTDISSWVKFRNSVAHHGTEMPTSCQAREAAKQWCNLLNSWLLVHLGADPVTVASLFRK